MTPSTVDVACPRCSQPIVCTLKLTPETERLTERGVVAAVDLVGFTASVPDLAECFAAHYREAGHARVVTDTIEKVRLTGRSLRDAARAAGERMSAAVWQDGTPATPFDDEHPEKYSAVVEIGATGADKPFADPNSNPQVDARDAAPRLSGRVS